MVDTLENNSLVEKLINLALEEDLSFGDITGELTIPKEKKGVGKLLAKEPLVVCGLSLISKIMKCAGYRSEINLLTQDGTRLNGKKEIMAEVYGSVRELLAIERTILNFLQRLSGVATHTKKIVDASSGITVLDTRKTTPGWRILEKYAVRIGGGKNHRFSLGDLILVKNNHIDCAGSIKEMYLRIKKDKPFYTPIEVEVRSFSELKEVIECGPPQIVMLDNMNNDQIKESLIYLNEFAPGVLVEVSGGITPDRLIQLKAIGVKAVSMGDLTTKAVNVDISFSISAL